MRDRNERNEESPEKKPEAPRTVPVCFTEQALFLAYARRKAWTPVPADIPPINHQFRVMEITTASTGLRLGVVITTIVR